VCLRITDNGCGFPEAILMRAFEPYVTTKPKGTGLGLAIVKKIVDEHNGTVRVENLPGRGARVSVTLPLRSETAETS
jgi:signal transduction histidine kinase